MKIKPIIRIKGIVWDIGNVLGKFDHMKALKKLPEYKKIMADPKEKIEFKKNSFFPDNIYPPCDKTPVPDEIFDFHYENKVYANEIKKKSAGAIVYNKESNKIWIIEPTNHFGGYKHTYPKGGIEGDEFDIEAAQKCAIKEVWEESGLEVELKGYLGEYEKSMSTTKYYIGEVKGGNPTKFGRESQSVKLIPMNEVEALLNTDIDKTIFADFKKFYKEAKKLHDDGFSDNMKDCFDQVKKVEMETAKAK